MIPFLKYNKMKKSVFFYQFFKIITYNKCEESVIQKKKEFIVVFSLSHMGFHGISIIFYTYLYKNVTLSMMKS